MTSRLLLRAVPLALLFVSAVWAQFDMAQCPAGWEWNRNSLSQDPCTVGSLMDASCRGLALYTYPPLNISQYYLPPRTNHTGDLDCDCNTVMYSLYMACASCQGGSVYPWTTWIAACENVYISQYPKDLPQGTAVPHWAYFNVTTAPNQTYSDATAMNLGPDPEEMPKAVNTMSTDSSSRTTLSLSTTKTSGSQPGSTGSTSNGSSVPQGKTNTGAIVGGVVGSIVPLTILAVAAFFYVRHRKQQQALQQRLKNPELLDPYQQRPPSMYNPPMTAPLVTSPPVTSSFTPYNPNDPSTFPPQTPPTSVTYTTPSSNNRGTYSGIPEV